MNEVGELTLKGTKCVDGGECGPEIIKRRDPDGRKDVWCCVWCGFPVPFEEISSKENGMEEAKA